MLSESEIRLKLKATQNAKIEHVQSLQCKRWQGDGCTGCHFWSGVISALSEVLGINNQNKISNNAVERDG